MTYLAVSYRYTGLLTPAQLRRVGDLPGHYGILRIRLDEKNCVAHIEYDASRLKETEVVHWVRCAGLPLTEKIPTDAVAA